MPNKVRSLTDYARPYILSKKLFESALGFRAIRSFVSGLDLQNSLTVIAKTIWILEDKGHYTFEIQNYLASKFLTPSRYQTAQSIWRGNKAYIFYFRSQLHLVTKYLAMYSRLNVPAQPVTRLEALGCALHAATDMIARESEKVSEKLKLEDDFERLTYQVIIGEHLVKSPNFLWEIVRSKSIYSYWHRKLSENLAEYADYLDIEQVFLDATGVSLSAFLEVGFGFVANMLRFRDHEGILPKEQDFILFHPKTFFRSSKISEEIVARVFEAVSMEIDELKANAETQSSRDLTHDFLKMKERPLIRMGDDTYLPLSFDFVCERLSTGVYWIIFDALSEPGKDKHIQFSRYNGILFEYYVRNVMDGIVSQSSTVPELTCQDHKYKVAGQEKKTADFLWVGDDFVLVIEVTASRIKAKRTISMGISEALRDDFDKIIFKKAKELSNFIDDLVNKKVVLDEKVVDVGQKRVYPLIISIEKFPRMPVVDAYISNKIREMGIFSFDNIAPLSIISVDEVEQVVRSSQIDFVKVIKTWSADPDFQYTSLGQFLSSNFPIESGNESPWYKDNVIRVFNETSMTIFGRSYEELVIEQEKKS